MGTSKIQALSKTFNANLELAVSGIAREPDYRYAIDDPFGIMTATVPDDGRGDIDGFVLAIKHHALPMIGPMVARTEDDAIALLRTMLDRFRSSSALLVVPMACRKVVAALYGWGAECRDSSAAGERSVPAFRGREFPQFSA
ncbi:hypothetical protein [Methylobacter sp. YRD-M1]|uniref:hypothetical protein n=1 Tax=Methylobacter sp. YRD-M1 TaxID=2911520 RepID=UPI00227AA7AB|nr:hypothetical protein [Methylobacter sp. YRD-M1]WAK00832.1 hypothetical protein LZ558_13390 [Methylobacter sp. YRD-M1]